MRLLRGTLEYWCENSDPNGREKWCCSSAFLEVLLARPRAIEILKGYRYLFFESSEIEKVKTLPEYQNASEEAKTIVDALPILE